MVFLLRSEPAHRADALVASQPTFMSFMSTP
jgi:hypothetical protein